MPTTQQDIQIGLRLRAYRKAANITQEKLGKALGVTFQQIQKYENGKNRLSGSRMLIVLKTLQDRRRSAARPRRAHPQPGRTQRRV